MDYKNQPFSFTNITITAQPKYPEDLVKSKLKDDKLILHRCDKNNKYNSCGKTK